MMRYFVHVGNLLTHIFHFTSFAGKASFSPSTSAWPGFAATRRNPGISRLPGHANQISVQSVARMKPREIREPLSHGSLRILFHPIEVTFQKLLPRLKQALIPNYFLWFENDQSFRIGVMQVDQRILVKLHDNGRDNSLRHELLPTLRGSKLYIGVVRVRGITLGRLG